MDAGQEKAKIKEKDQKMLWIKSKHSVAAALRQYSLLLVHHSLNVLSHCS